MSITKQAEVRKVNVNLDSKSRGCGAKDMCLTPREPYVLRAGGGGIMPSVYPIIYFSVFFNARKV